MHSPCPRLVPKGKTHLRYRLPFFLVHFQSLNKYKKRKPAPVRSSKSNKDSLKDIVPPSVGALLFCCQRRKVPPHPFKAPIAHRNPISYFWYAFFRTYSVFIKRFLFLQSKKAYQKAELKLLACLFPCFLLLQTLKLCLFPNYLKKHSKMRTPILPFRQNKL